MHQSKRTGDVVEAWQLPVLGTPAAQDLPPWLVEALMDRRIQINSLGGVTPFGCDDTSGCVAGDFIVRYPDGTIALTPAETFDDCYAPAVQLAA
ncbi:hypothetical protein [Methylobacterium ajmalii]|uniref:hypothetical protein n=1 Tax=Methylobacterium ajmalii TaxID=2738439 RepID=UPI002F35670B